MITPTRFGLKYTPVPTLALEYEDDLGAVEGAGATSLYVFREDASRRRVKKLHVVELPMLTKASETRRILEQLQRDNSKFLSPSVVNEDQLQRLLDLLVERLEVAQAARDPNPHDTAPVSSPASHERASAVVEEEEEEEEEDEKHGSMTEESVVESSHALESPEPPIGHRPARSSTDMAPAPNRGTFLSQEESEDKEQDTGADGDRGGDEASKRDGGDHSDEAYDSPDKAAITSNTEVSPSVAAAADDADKRRDKETEEERKKALLSGSEVSEEDIQSEELEYFSEDGSDEDSF